MSSIWSKYVIRETLKVFFFFILSLYFLYILIDYSSRIDYYNSLSFGQICSYYIFTLSQKTELLIPFAFTVTVIKVLTSLNIHNEFVSMLMSGKSYKRLLAPLTVVALILTLFLYLNFQFLEPLAQKRIETIKQKRKKSSTSLIKSFILDDGSKLIFQDYDLTSKTLQNIYWIRSSQQIYYIQKLEPFTTPPVGHEVSIFNKNTSGEFQFIQKKELQALDEMQINFDPLVKTFFSLKTYSISALFYALHNPQALLNTPAAAILTQLNYKLIFPLLPLFILITLAPICTRFSRSVPTFLITALSIFALLSFYTLMDACYILSENKIIWPQVAMWVPLMLYFGYPTKKFISY